MRLHLRLPAGSLRGVRGPGLKLISDNWLLSEKYFQLRRMVSRGTKIRRARLTRHAWCVRRTPRRQKSFLCADCYECRCPPTSRPFLQVAEVLKVAGALPATLTPRHAATGRFRRTRPTASFWRADCADLEDAPAQVAARADWDKRGYRHAVPGHPGPRGYDQTYEDLKNAA